MGWFKTFALAAVASAALTGAAAAQVTYNRGNDADPETLDPHKTSTVYEANILRDLYEGLVIHDAPARSSPGVAEKHEIIATTAASTASRSAPTRNGRTATRSRRPTSSSPSAASWTRRPARNTPTSSIRSSTPRRSTRASRREARGARRQGGRRPHARDHARAPDALLPRAPDASDRPAGASGLRREARHELRQAREHGLERRLCAEGVGAELAHPRSRRTRSSTPPRTSRSTSSATSRRRTSPPRRGASWPASCTRRATSRPTRSSS